MDDRITGSITAQTGLQGEPFYRPGSANEGKFMLNLQEINRKIMIEAGILPHRIEMTKLCTSCAVSRFFSHRKENGRTGRMAAWIGWVSQSG
ncbi:Multi-copper polyphenol oxidoreductase laccase [compost metagenome]